MDKSDILVLCSGGLDSVVAAKKLQRGGYNISLFYVAYGSRAEAKELVVVDGIAKHFGIDLIILPIEGLLCLQSGLLNRNVQDIASLKGADAWVPARNLLLVSLALAYGSTRGIKTVAIGNVADGIYADNKPEFTKQFNLLIPHAVGPDCGMSIVAPVGHLKKSEVIELGIGLNVPFEKTWSCYDTATYHCGVCGSCISRRKAFQATEYYDPTVYAQPMPEV